MTELPELQEKPDQAISAKAEAALHAHKKPHRTLGLRLYDIFLYPFLTNFVVFAMSVGATYLTAHGDKQGGWLGKIFFNRGRVLMETLQSWGMSENSADMAKMVAFSFIDGTFVAPLVKLFEDRREKIGKWIDDRLGTTPENLEAYKAEPKQTWKSVIAGRVATASVVVPTAMLLDKTGLNDKLFNNPGHKHGEWIAERPQFAKFFGKLDIPTIMRVSYFEAFYTSVCTAGLYFISRFVARKFEPKPQTETDSKSQGHKPSIPSAEQVEQQANTLIKERAKETPTLAVRDIAAHQRIDTVQAQGAQVS